MTPPLKIFVLSMRGIETARKIKAGIGDATILGLEGRVEGADQSFASFGDTLREHYRIGSPIVALCAAGITIRSLAPVLANKGAEPPVLAAVDDGSAIVPLLGGTTGVNGLARRIASVLDIAPAITTSGELHFGT